MAKSESEWTTAEILEALGITACTFILEICLSLPSMSIPFGGPGIMGLAKISKIVLVLVARGVTWERPGPESERFVLSLACSDFPVWKECPGL